MESKGALTKDKSSDILETSCIPTSASLDFFFFFFPISQ
jgi:hypothetical protein